MEREQRLAKATSLISKRSNVDMFLDWCTARALSMSLLET